jgi:hypothetical protein
MAIRRVNGKTTREYRAWKAMKARCYAPSTRSSYKEKNITVCDEWNNSFEKFLKDMGECPENYSLDRIDNNGNYCKENCRWTTSKEQSSNRGSFNLIFTYEGESKVLKDWARHFGMSYSCLYQRIVKQNLSFEESIEIDRNKVFMTYQDKTLRIKEWSELTGISYQIIIDRRRKGWPVEKILSQKPRIKI